MINRNNKKGFTIVELVIVIAVIAILAAVLIPTFAGIIKKANLSADMQAVRQMNVALAADGAVTPTDIFNLHEVLAENGMTSEDYHPLTNDTYFFWDADLNRVLHVDKDMIVIAPEEYKGQAYSTTSKWYSLSLEIMEEKVTGVTNEATVAVTNGAQMQYVLNKLNEGKIDTLTVTLNGNIDMMGAAFNIPESVTDITISGINNAVIKNATAVDNATEARSGRDGEDGKYNCALIPVVNGSATIENVIIENMNVKNTDVGNVGLIFGDITGTATIKDVTIKNSTVIGHRNVGALVGQFGSGTLTLAGTIDLQNVDVMTVGGRSGMLIGLIDAKTTAEDGTKTDAEVITTGATIKLDENCSYGIYECEQNKGVYSGNDLGLKDGKITSYASTYNEETKEYEKEIKVNLYVENALAITETKNNEFAEDKTTFAAAEWAK